MTTPEVNALKHRGYDPNSYYLNNSELRRAIDALKLGINGATFPEIASSLTGSDPYMAMADFDDYRRAQRDVVKAWADRERWNRMSLMNTSGAGRFAADRAIQEYAKDIWHTGNVTK